MSQGARGPSEGRPRPRTSTRRRVLYGAGLAAAAVAIGDGVYEALRPGSSALSAGLTPLRASLHTHASASEGIGAYDGHLDQASAHGFGVVAFTEHNITMRADAVPPFPFAGPRLALTQGSIHLIEESEGPLAHYSRTFLPDRLSGATAYFVTAESKPGGTAYCGAYLNDFVTATVPFLPYRRPTFLQTPIVSVRVDSSGPDAIGVVRFDLSWHPPYSGRPAGRYQVEYRFLGGAGDAVTRYETDGLKGIVTVSVALGVWTRQRMKLNDDASLLWPDSFVPGDNVMPIAHFGAVSQRGARASVAFQNYALDRGGSVDALATQAQILAAYAKRHPDLLIIQGVELSDAHHINYYGPAPFLDPLVTLADQVVASRRRAGVVSYNHPFGTDESGFSNPATRQSKLADTIADHLKFDFYDVDVLEIYPKIRGGVGIEEHIELWDVASRNGHFLTQDMTSDDHSGVDWLKEKNPGYTSVYMAQRSLPELQKGLATGRAFSGVLGEFDGVLDIGLGTVPMGGIRVGGSPGRELAVHAAGLKDGDVVEVLQGPVDHAGKADPHSGIRLVSSHAPRSFGLHPANLPVPDPRNTYTRVQVRNSDGAIVALSQPVWSLDKVPGKGVPAHRLHRR